MTRCSWLVSSHPPPEAVDPSRALLRIVLGLAGLALFSLPAFVVFGQDWLALGQGPGASIERWTVFAVFYLGWALTVVIAFVWVNDRLGVHWYAHERSARLGARRRRRLGAGLRFLGGRQDAHGSRARRTRRP